jgi:hypothetical protein
MQAAKTTGILCENMNAGGTGTAKLNAVGLEVTKMAVLQLHELIQAGHIS